MDCKVDLKMYCKVECDVDCKVDSKVDRKVDCKWILRWIVKWIVGWIIRWVVRWIVRWILTLIRRWFKRGIVEWSVRSIVHSPMLSIPGRLFGTPWQKQVKNWPFYPLLQNLRLWRSIRQFSYLKGHFIIHNYCGTSENQPITHIYMLQYTSVYYTCMINFEIFHPTPIIWHLPLLSHFRKISTLGWLLPPPPLLSTGD